MSGSVQGSASPTPRITAYAPPRGDAVGCQFAAEAAAVDDGPLAAFAYPDCHRLHNAAAVGGAVAGFFVHMKTGQAVGAMVAVVAPGV